MIIKRSSHTQKEELKSNIWEVSIPEGGIRGRPLGAYDGNGNSLEVDSWSLEEGVLKVNFGIDPVFGVLEYEYQIEGNDPISVSGDGGVMNITINQNNSGAAKTPITFP